MNRSRNEKSAGNDNPLEDPAFIEDAMRGLFESEAEFPIKVDGASTLPYASVLSEIRGKNEQLVLKLIRPLPHELMTGAVFRIIFPLDDRRYEAQITFLGREGYLQYLFGPPACLALTDRRSTNRFPFRPRENAYVTAQDGRIPALGVAGPLVNIGLGGFAMRLDRVLQLDDGMRIPVNTALFDRDKGFPRVRIQDLPRLPLLEWRGIVAHVTARGDEVILGFSFGELGENEARLLGDCLAFREKTLRGGTHVPGRTDGETSVAVAHDVRSELTGESALEEAELPTELSLELGPLLRMQRRSARILLCMAEGDLRKRTQDCLQANGFGRLECPSGLAELKQLIPAKGSQPAAAWVLVDLALAAGVDVEPLAGLRILERELGDLGKLPVAVICAEVDPALLMGLGDNFRILPYLAKDSEEHPTWTQAIQSISVF